MDVEFQIVLNLPTFFCFLCTNDLCGCVIDMINFLVAINLMLYFLFMIAAACLIRKY